MTSPRVRTIPLSRDRSNDRAALSGFEEQLAGSGETTDDRMQTLWQGNWQGCSY